MIQITHIISGLERGGAESMLQKLIGSLDPTVFQSRVISLSTLGVVGAELQATGIEVVALGLDPRRPNPLALVKLGRLLQRQAPDIVQTWMYHADLLGGLVARFARRRTVIWNIRHSNLDPGIDSRNTRLVARCCATLSRLIPARIICCAESARRSHAALGYSTRQMQVIANGFDTDRFAPSKHQQQALRSQLGLPVDSPLVGLVARFHPHKAHGVFLQAAARVIQQHPECHFLLCGSGVDRNNRELLTEIQRLDIDTHCHLLGEQREIASVQAALTLACSTSSGEGFSNAIGEAMACGVPAVVSNVGDSARLVGNSGWVVRAGDAKALANALLEALALEPAAYEQRATAARARILEYFSLEQIAREYGQLYLDALPTPGLEQV